MKATTTIVIDKRRVLKNGKYPVKLRVTHNGEQHYYPADLSLTPDEFDCVKGKNPKGDLKKWKLKLDALEQKANHIIDGLTLFDFHQFKKSLYSDQQLRNDVYNHYGKIINRLKLDGQIGTAANYTASLRSLKNFRAKLTFMDVTVDFLKAYEKSLIDDNKSITTVGIYLRPLRAIINHAISEKILPQEYNYPFGSKRKLKYQIPTSKNTKKALTLAEIKLLYNYKAESDSWEQKARDFWIFSYLANGMNMKDVAHLRYGDIDGEYIKFIRAKTMNTNKVVSAITISLTEDLKDIIGKWGNNKPTDESLIFPIIKLSDSLEKQQADIHQFIKMVNKYMRIVAKNVGINKPITTYYARHSFSTVLMRSGTANIQFISEALGHSSTNTTKAYLDSFEDETKKEVAKALTAFV